MDSRNNTGARNGQMPFILNIPSQFQRPFIPASVLRQEIVAISSDSETESRNTQPPQQSLSVDPLEIQILSSDSDSEDEFPPAHEMVDRITASVEAVIGPALMHDPADTEYIAASYVFLF